MTYRAWFLFVYFLTCACVLVGAYGLSVSHEYARTHEAPTYAPTNGEENGR